jgi:DNA polymerase/3'-5' exonuclease PolX
MSTGAKVPYATAMAAAQSLLTVLDPFCARLLIAGSLRRGLRAVGDVELVVIPAFEPILDLFGEPSGLFRTMLVDGLADVGITTFRKNGPKFKQFTWQDLPVDLFIASVETWGCVATIRTGSADFAHWLVTSTSQGGACPVLYRFQDGRMEQGATPLQTPEERDVFALLRLDWVEPSDRVAGRWRTR